MNILSFLSAVALTLTLAEGMAVLLKDIRSETNRVFFYICLSISLWLFGACFGYSSSTSREAFLWLKVTSAGFIFMHAFVLHFILIYTGFTKSRFIYLIYIPSLLFMYISITGNLVFTDIIRSGNYWVMIPDYDSATFYFFMLNYLSYYAVSLAILFLYRKKTASERIRKQSRIISLAIILTITSYNAEPFLAPLLFNYNTYGQAPIYSIVWITLLWYAMVKFGFPGIDKKYLFAGIFDSLSEMVIMLDEKENIILVNRTLIRRFGEVSRPLSLNTFFVEHEMLSRLIDSSKNQQPLPVTLNLALPVNKRTVNVEILPLKDRFNDRTGSVIIARDIISLHTRLTEQGITEREYEIIKLVISGNSNNSISGHLNIKLRTVETHITNIFSKLGLKNRSELINYCTDIPSAELKT